MLLPTPQVLFQIAYRKSSEIKRFFTFILNIPWFVVSFFICYFLNAGNSLFPCVFFHKGYNRNPNSVE